MIVVVGVFIARDFVFKDSTFWVRNQGAVLKTESFGDKNNSNKAIILVHGTGTVSEFWDESFINKLTTEGFFVIRYDQRDSGSSTHFENGHYKAQDLVIDLLSVLDAYKIQAADIIGHNMGAYVMTLLQVYYKERCKHTIALGFNPAMTPANLESLSLSPYNPLFKNLINQAQLTGAFYDDTPLIEPLFSYLHGTIPVQKDKAQALIKALYTKDKRDVKMVLNHQKAFENVPVAATYLKKNSIPLLIVIGEHDKLTKPDAIPLPQTSYATVPGAGHLFLNEGVWELISTICLEFLQK